MDRRPVDGNVPDFMRRLLMFSLAALAFSQTAPAQDARRAVGEFRERQFLQGQRIGCSLRTAQAIQEQDVKRLEQLERECAALGRRTSS